MNRTVATLAILIVIIATFSVSARPTATSLQRYKRQSDQRLAELETLLALQKYGRHRLRPDRKEETRPGYGVVDFNLIGRRKKSLRFSPGGGEGEGRIGSSSGEESDVDQVLTQDLPSWVSKDSDLVSPPDPLDNEKIDRLISFPASLLGNNPQSHPRRQQQQEGLDIIMDKKKFLEQMERTSLSVFCPLMKNGIDEE